jgi:predicted alpha/beta-fold hydrolase
VNALDDTFLSESCYPYELAKNHHFFHFEAPKNGGHVGFISFKKKGMIWSEERAIQFANSSS